MYLLSIGPTSTVEQDSSSEIALDKVKSWLQTCLDEHSLCRKVVDTQNLPGRLLQVDLKNPRLVLSGADTTRYIALSYCWGKMHSPTTTTKNLTAHMHDGISPEQLPKTYIDLIEIARYLGVQYVWIDALCIIQDSKQDWATESGKMCSVYEQAVLSIAADCAAETRAGIFSPQSYARETISLNYGRIPIYVRRYTGTSHNPREPLHMLDFRPSTSDRPLGQQGSDMPLGKRAWALQEGVLSTRIVHFTGKELVWECNEAYLCECGQTGPPEPGLSNRTVRVPELLNIPSSPEELADQWRGFIEIYAMRSLTFNSDKPVAISRLAKKMQAAIHHATGKNPTYLTGLWSVSLAQDLLWRPKRDDLGGYYNRSKSQETCSAPTWSWMSWNGAVIPFYSIGDISRKGMLGKMFPRSDKVHQVKDEIELMEFSCGTTTMDVMIDTMVSTLTLKGQLAEVGLSEETATFGRLSGSYSVVSRANGKSYAVTLDHGCEEVEPLIFDESESEANPTEERTITRAKYYCLRIGSTVSESSWETFFLVLKESTRVLGAYERIGVSEIVLARDNMGAYSKYFNLFEGVEKVCLRFV